MRYAIYDTESGELLHRYSSQDAKLAKAHGSRAGCRLELIKQPRSLTPYQKARAISATLNQSFPF